MTASPPAPDLAFAAPGLRAHLLSGGPLPAVVFGIDAPLAVAPPAQGAQRSAVIAGEREQTVDGVTRGPGPGESHDIPAGAVHSTRLAAGSRVSDVFAGADRFRPGH